MLTFMIGLGDAGTPWRQEGRRFVEGRSWVEPFPHPALECDVVTDGVECTCLIVRERVPGSPCGAPVPRTVSAAEYASALDAVDTWPADTVIVESSRRGWVRVRAGRGGVAPVHVAARDGVLYGSWNPADLRPFAGPGLDEREVTRRLTMRPRYGHAMFATGLHRVTERATAHYDGTLTVHYPAAAPHTRARTLRPDADVLGAYEALLDQALDRHVYDPDATAVQLSGGLDSANVAMALAAQHPGRITTGAMTLDGEAGAQQDRRRAEMLTHGGFRTDVRVPAIAYPPLHPCGTRARGAPVTPYEDIYLEANEVLLAGFAARGIRTVFTGIGGDEMVAVSSREHPHPAVGTDRPPMPWIGKRARDLLDAVDEDIAPASIVNEMTLLAHAAAAPAMLRAGLWPVHPYADPDLIRFGEWLPRHWRSGKRLHRARLQHLGLSTDVAYPRIPENFSTIMRHSLIRHVVPHAAELLRTGSPLIDDGFLDPDGLAAAIHRIGTGTIGERDHELYHAVALDLAVRAFTGETLPCT